MTRPYLERGQLVKAMLLVTIVTIFLVLLVGCASIQQTTSYVAAHPEQQAAKKWRAVAVSAVAADIATTQIGLRQGYSEGNPVYGPHPSAGKMLAVNAVALGVAWWVISHMDEPAQARAWKYLSFFRGGIVAYNVGVLANDKHTTVRRCP